MSAQWTYNTMVETNSTLLVSLLIQSYRRRLHKILTLITQCLCQSFLALTRQWQLLPLGIRNFVLFTLGFSTLTIQYTKCIKMPFFQWCFFLFSRVSTYYLCFINSNFFIACRDEENSAEFQIFCKQLYHASLAIFMQPLWLGMTTSEVVKCPDERLQ